MNPGLSTGWHPRHRRRASPEWAQELPADSQAVVREIYDAVDVDCLRLATMGARALIDLMLADMLTKDKDTFEQKLDKAVEAGLIGASQKTKLAIAIEAGSAASHRGFAPTLSQVEDVLEIVETNLKDRYVVQAASDRLREKIPQRRKGG